MPSPGTARPSAWTGAICGLITAAVAMGVAQLVAGLTTPQASPVVDVGQAVIGGTPLPVKDWATATFGTNDKTFLVGGVLVLLFAFAAVIGVIAVRRVEYGMAGLGIFAAIGARGGAHPAGRDRLLDLADPRRGRRRRGGAIAADQERHAGSG